MDLTTRTILAPATRASDWLNEPACATEQAEKRIASDGRAYTRYEFEQWYCTSAAAAADIWADAKPEDGAAEHASQSGAPIAQLESPCSAAQPAQDGQSWYGAAARTKLEEQWHPRASDSDARGPPASEATEHASQNSVPRPVPMRRDDGDSAEQPASSQEDACAGCDDSSARQRHSH